MDFYDAGSGDHIELISLFIGQHNVSVVSGTVHYGASSYPLSGGTEKVPFFRVPNYSGIMCFIRVVQNGSYNCYSKPF